MASDGTSAGVSIGNELTAIPHSRAGQLGQRLREVAAARPVTNEVQWAYAKRGGGLASADKLDDRSGSCEIEMPGCVEDFETNDPLPGIEIGHQPRKQRLGAYPRPFVRWARALTACAAPATAISAIFRS